MRPILNPPPHVYSSEGFDRSVEHRRDVDWLRARRADPGTRAVRLSNLRVLVTEKEGAPRAAVTTVAELGRPLPESATFLGVDADGPLFSIEGDEPDDPTEGFVELRSVGTALPAAEAGLLAYARALAHWHVTHRFCGACGTRMERVDAGHAHHCPACGREVFPRTDPAVIVLVTSGERCILGRSARFVTGMYSTLAGFVEASESLEQTLAREVMEEVGVEIARGVYRSSQPWPFPQSLMLGFRAQALTETIRIDPEEIEDARWFTRAELLDEEHRPVRLPGPDSIARYLIEDWLAEGS
jgi:NAD+ diphosphatase